MTEHSIEKRICVIGGGRWGQNHIRTLFAMGVLAGIVESDSARLEELKELYKPIRGFTKVESTYEEQFDGYIVATPAHTHFLIAKALIEKKFDVLIEKPMTLSSKEAMELIKLSKENNVRLMVGHLLLFHPAIRKMKEVVDAGTIGKLSYIYSNRLNFGTVRTEENVFWSFAPHDISIFDYFIGKSPEAVSMSGGAFLQNGIHDTVLANISYPDNIKTHIFVSWLHPFKEHRLVIMGSKGSIVYEDSSKDKQILLYDKSFKIAGGQPVKMDGEVQSIPYENSAPLENELKYFIGSERKGSIADGHSGYEVVALLESADQKLKIKDEKSKMEKEFYVHESSYVDENVIIGKGTKIWHFSHIQKGANIGENCSIGQNVNVANNVRIGNNVKIQNNVSVYEGVELEDYVFCGPSMVFTNVKDPRCKYPQRGGSHYHKTLVREGASIGANATIVCGHTVGRHAFIAAGAVVASDVPDYALMLGVPARRKGWVCECGEQLKPSLVCKRCNRKYIEKNEILSEVQE